MDILKIVIRAILFSLPAAAFLYLNIVQARRLRMLDIESLPGDEAQRFGAWRSCKLGAWKWGRVGWASFCLLVLGGDWLPNLVLLPILAAVVVPAAMALVGHEKAMRLKKKVPAWLVEQTGNHFGKLKHAWLVPALAFVVVFTGVPLLLKASPAGKIAAEPVKSGTTAPAATAPVVPATPSAVADVAPEAQSAPAPEDPFAENPAAR